MSDAAWIPDPDDGARGEDHGGAQHGDRGGARRDGEGKKSAAALLVDLALERYDFGCTEDGEAYALARPAGHVVRMLTGGQVSLRTELASAYRAATGKVAGQQALADALLVLAGIAQEAEPEPVGLRVAESGSAVWLDLGDKAEHVVMLDGRGWQVYDSAPVRFRRTRLTGPLPVPMAGGDMAELWELLNVAGPDRPLVLAWLVASVIAPDIPHPVLALLGEQGTGKSSTSRLLVSLVDPSPVPLRKPPKDPEGWVTAAAGSWLVGLDNLSAVAAWFSDSLCRAATGDGDVRRALYTDGGLAVFAFRRCVLLNGIDVGALRGDLADRALVVELEVIPEHRRRTEAELAEEWAQSYPRILGALLTECSECLAQLPSVRLGGSPRMADFARILAALDDSHGTTGLARYIGQARTLAADTLTAEPFLGAMLIAVPEPFSGTAAELLEVVTPTEPEWRRPRDWPTARGVTGLLKRNAPGLRKLGWTVEQAGQDGEARSLRWHLSPPEIAGNPRSERSDTRETTEQPSEPSDVSPQSQDDDPARAWDATLFEEPCTNRAHNPRLSGGRWSCSDCDAEHEEERTA